ncbi:SDR family oxidoreductase [Acinetobacter pittii]|uniref:SDR family oxidoreductase n=1 Tax=Acinetobacter pittii TaxID=48296 RepID=UPI001C24FEB4|nr:SDR family oxidoreductase [Acinetobacter pittii]QXA09795.1 SDR family oxidoreductase [Acinetobacter pittii]
MRIAVTGASGQLGQLIISQLLERTEAKNIVALVRSPEKASDLSAKGVEVRAFDYVQDADKLSAQLAGIDKLLLISSNEIGQRTVQHQNVINAAKLTQIKFIVYTSLLNADTTPLLLAKEHVETEQYLKTSNIPHTVLRNNWYNENYAMGLAQAVDHGKILGATHHGKIASASRLDYATAAAVVLTQEGHQNKVYELAGDTSYTLDDVAKWASEHSKKEVIYQDLSEEEYKAILIQLGIPEGFANILADSDEGVSKGGLYSDRKDLHQLIGRATTSMQETIKEFLS